MSAKGLDAKMARGAIRCYELGGVLYVPTYEDRQVFARPGGGTYTELDLRTAGASPRLHNLWRRP